MLKTKLQETVDKLLSFESRCSGSNEELETAKYIHQQFQSFGLESEIQYFQADSHNAISAELSVRNENFDVLPAQFSAAGSISGELIYLGNCSDPFNLKNDVQGKIGMLFAGKLSHSACIDFLMELESRGMLGLIVISSKRDNIETKNIRYGEIKTMPIVCCSWMNGNRLMHYEHQTFKLAVKWCENPRQNQSQNVVATIPGTGPYWMFVSAHHDTGAFVPGAMDNAGGTAILIEVARKLAEKRFPTTIYIVSTGSEENGGRTVCGAGATFFVESMKKQLNKCIAHVEIDDVGNLLGIPEIFYRGSKQFKELLFENKVKQAYQINEKSFHSCDNGASSKHGLPYVWFTDAISIPRPWYHTPDDTVDKMCYDRLLKHFPFVEEMVCKLAEAKPFYPYIRQDELLLRPAYYSDLKAVREINRLAFEDVSLDKIQEKYFDGQLGGKSWDIYKNQQMDNLFKQALDTIIVCEKSGVVTGYATVIFHREKGIAEIGNNAVHPDFQRQGIGKFMQSEILRRMKAEGFTQFQVSTLTCDTAAQKLYEKLGYEAVAGSIIYLKDRK